MDGRISAMFDIIKHCILLFAAIAKVVYFLNAPAPSSPFSLFPHYCWAPRGSSLLVPSAQNINTQLSVKGSTYLRSFVECW